MKNEIKHPLERYKLIADPTIRQQCIENFDEEYYLDYCSRNPDDGSVQDAILNGFNFRKSKQCAKYWYDIAINNNIALLPEPIEDNPTFNLNEAINVTKDGYKLTELDQLRTENDRLQKVLDFNVKENVNILRQFSEKIAENEKLRECLAYWFSEHTLETTHSSKAHEYREKSEQLLNK